ncbi:MAG: GxxExxY protein [Phycisphaerales bacterium]|nr:GxxExxY protein [Phycisphaerales bacterium]
MQDPIDRYPELAERDELTRETIGAAIAVHKTLGPGLLEGVYHECMKLELSARGIPFESEVAVPIVYRGVQLKAQHRIDLIVAKRVIVELKAVDTLAKIHEAQLLTYLRLTGLKTGLLFNFNSPYLKDAMKRILL